MTTITRSLPRRSSARWLVGAPTDVIAIYDNGGATADRYSVLLREWHDSRQGLVACLGLSENPSHPQGVSQFSGAQRGRHLGEKKRWSDLPLAIQRHVEARLAA